MIEFVCMCLYLALCPYWLAPGTGMRVSIGTRIIALCLEFPLFREDIGKAKECEFICLATSICTYKKICIFENLHFILKKLPSRRYYAWRNTLTVESLWFYRSHSSFLWDFKNQIKVENKIERYSPCRVLQIFLIDFFPVQEPLFLIVLVISE